MHQLNSHPVFPEVQHGASLFLAFRANPNKAVLILGSDQLAASRAFSALEADFDVIIMTPAGRTSVCEELAWRADQAELTIIDSSALSSAVPLPNTGSERDAQALA